MHIRKLLPLLFIFLFLISASAIHATSFSVTPGSPVGLLPEDILAPGPAVIFNGGSGFLDINAFSYGHTRITTDDISQVGFSVNLASIGVAGSAVNTEFFLNYADIFYSNINNTNLLLYDGDGSSGRGLGLAEGIPNENVDGFDYNSAPGLGSAGGLIWFTFDALSPADIYVTVAGPNFLIIPPGVVLFANAAALGLGAADNIDALVILEDGVNVGLAMDVNGSDCVLFSLTPQSPTLGAIGASPGDILQTGPGCQGPAVFIPAASIGLLAADDLNALAIPFTPTAVTLQEVSANSNAWQETFLMTAVVLLALSVTLFFYRKSRLSRQ